MRKAANHKQTCCGQSRKNLHTALACPVNGKKGHRVSSETLRHLLKIEQIRDVKDSGYYFCKTADCDTVYYHPESGQTFDKNDLKVRVGLKETEDPVWVCYCFNISKKMIHEEIEATGRSSFGDFIRNEVALGNCACEIKNPSGRCCLGEVRAAEKEGFSRLNAMNKRHQTS